MDTIPYKCIARDPVTGIRYEKTGEKKVQCVENPHIPETPEQTAQRYEDTLAGLKHMTAVMAHGKQVYVRKADGEWATGTLGRYDWQEDDTVRIQLDTHEVLDIPLAEAHVRIRKAPIVPKYQVESAPVV